MVRRQWLAHLLPAQAVLLRAPAVEQINLEDWLLDQAAPAADPPTVVAKA
jgi:hypothetical protein